MSENGKVISLNSHPEFQVGFDDWSKMDIRIAKIKDVRNHPNADKLYVLKIDLGPKLGERTIVSGIRDNYKRRELIGKKIVVIINLEPRILRGIKSEGMLLAATEKTKSSENVFLLVPDSNVAKVGLRIH